MDIKKDTSAMWGIFIFSPFLSLLFAFKNFRYANAKNILWAFTVFYGFTLVISNDTMDANRYRDQFLELSKVTLTFNQFTQTLYDVDSKSVDILDPTLKYLVSRVTDDYRFLFAVYGIVFGFLYSRNLWYILEKLGPNVKSVIFPLIITFALLSPIWDIVGFRFCTAQNVFFFGALPYLYERKKWGLIFMVLSIFVHFTFIFPLAILLIYLLLGNRLTLYFYFFIASMFITEINVESIKTFITNNLPEVFQVRTSGYTSEQRLETFRDSSTTAQINWYAKYYQIILKWTIVAYIFVIMLRGKKFVKDNKDMLRLLCFTLLLYGCANIFSLVPSGGRFVTLANMLSIAFIILYLQHGPQESMLKRLIPFTIPALMLNNIVTLRIGFDTIGVLTILGNPIVVMFISGDVALINIVKGLI